jgi:hypothetical protein
MKSSEEWILQSDYDISTAEAMYESGRYFYAVLCAIYRWKNV